MSIDFEAPEYSVPEDNGSIEVCAAIVEGTLGRDLTVTLTTSNGTATSEQNLVSVYVPRFRCII